MRLNLLDFLVCPGCGGALSAVPFKERERDPDFGHACGSWCAVRRVDPGKAEIDPETCETCRRREVIEGVLWCEPCRRVFPIHETIPELLPPEIAHWDVLREVMGVRFAARRWPEIAAAARAAEREADPEFEERERRKAKAKEERARKAAEGEGKRTAGKVEIPVPPPADPNDPWRYKRAEIALTAREDLPDGFFGPGLFVPFEPLHPMRATEKILRFMIPIHKSGLRHSELILDLGVGYAWTTEWLKKLGFEPVGVDINRDYLRVGLQRTEGKLPPLLIADVEDLPLRPGLFQAVLFYDAFHHVLDRERCLRSCASALVPGGAIYMAEPGAGHATHPAAVQVMRTWGILEKGITEDELRAMAEPAGFSSVTKAPYDYGDVEMLTAVKAGTRVYTSLGPNYLHAQIVPYRTGFEMKAGEDGGIRIGLTVKNDGDTVWLRKAPGGIGRVRIGFQLKTADRVLIDEHYLRVELPRNVLPGETVGLVADLPGIEEPGDYIVEIDAVDEGILWFKDVVYNPVPLTIKVK